MLANKWVSPDLLVKIKLLLPLDQEIYSANKSMVKKIFVGDSRGSSCCLFVFVPMYYIVYHVLFGISFAYQAILFLLSCIPWQAEAKRTLFFDSLAGDCQAVSSVFAIPSPLPCSLLPFYSFEYYAGSLDLFSSVRLLFDASYVLPSEDGILTDVLACLLFTFLTSLLLKIIVYVATLYSYLDFSDPSSKIPRRIKAEGIYVTDSSAIIEPQPQSNASPSSNSSRIVYPSKVIRPKLSFLYRLQLFLAIMCTICALNMFYVTLHFGSGFHAGYLTYDNYLLYTPFESGIYHWMVIWILDLISFVLLMLYYKFKFSKEYYEFRTIDDFGVPRVKKDAKFLAIVDEEDVVAPVFKEQEEMMMMMQDAIDVIAASELHDLELHDLELEGADDLEDLFKDLPALPNDK